MVEKVPAKRPSANDALRFPVVLRQIEVCVYTSQQNNRPVVYKWNFAVGCHCYSIKATVWTKPSLFMQVHDVTVTEFVYFVYLMNFIGGIIYDLFLSNIFIVFLNLKQLACITWTMNISQDGFWC